MNQRGEVMIMMAIFITVTLLGLGHQALKNEKVSKLQMEMVQGTMLEPDQP